jgi:hypothetical protein
LAISWIHSKTDDDDDAVGEREKKAENEQFLHQAFSSSGIGFLWGVLHGDHAVGYHHQLNAQIYSKTEMMVLFAKGKKKLKMNRFCTQLVFSHMEFSLWSVH